MNIQFHLTNMCNLRCKHCYQGEYNPEVISLENFEIVLKKTGDFFNSLNDPIHYLSLTGGDPLCIPNLKEYMLMADFYAKDICLMTNGLLLTPDYLKSLKETKHFNVVQVSLEGPEQINDLIRGEGTYKKIRKAIRYINEAGLYSSVSCTIAPYNYDKIDELYDDLVKYDSPKRLWFDRCIPFKGINVLSKEQFKIFIDKLENLQTRCKIEKLPTKPVSWRALQWFTGNKNRMYSCKAGLKHFTIMHNGDVMICRRLDFPIGNLLKEEWIDIIKRAMPILKNIHSLPTECSSCRYGNICNGGLKCLTYSVYGDFNHKDINCYFRRSF